MFKFFIVFIVILILLFPIKIKLTIFFDGKNLNIKIYKFSLIKTSIDELKNNVLKKKKSKEKNKNNILKKIKIDYFKLISNLNNNSFKGKLIISNSISYSTEDAAITAILFGVSNTLTYILFLLFDIFLNVKIKKNIINPLFENEKKIIFNNKSIIKINIVQIIIMIVILLKNIKLKGGTLKGKIYGK